MQIKITAICSLVSFHMAFLKKMNDKQCFDDVGKGVYKESLHTTPLGIMIIDIAINKNSMGIPQNKNRTIK